MSKNWWQTKEIEDNMDIKARVMHANRFDTHNTIKVHLSPIIKGGLASAFNN